MCLDVIYRQQGQEEILKAFEQSEKLNAEYKDIKNKLSELQQEMVQKADAYASKKTTALPSKIISYCMGPSSKSLQYMRSLNEPTSIHTFGDDENILEDATNQVDDKLDNSKSDNLAVDKQTKYYVQVGIFNDIKKVKTLLTNANYQIDISSVTLKGKKYNNVRVFGFDSHDDAKKAANEISSLLDLKAIVQKLSK